MEFIRQRFGKLAEALGDRPWLAGDFSVADIAMATVLREGIASGAVAEHPKLEAYLARCLARPAFDSAMQAQHAAVREGGESGREEGGGKEGVEGWRSGGCG